MKIVAAVAAMISGQTAAYPAVAPPGSPIGGRAGVVYVIVEAFDVVELVLISVDGAFVGDGTVVVCFHIHDVVVARVVHNDIHYYADTVSVSGVYQRLELCLCTEVSIGLGVVEHIVAVVGIVSKVTGAGVNIAVDLLVGSGEPDGVYAEVVKIAFVDFLGKTLEVAAVEGAGSGLPAAERVSVGVKSSAVGVVV